METDVAPRFSNLSSTIAPEAPKTTTTTSTTTAKTVSLATTMLSEQREELAPKISSAAAENDFTSIAMETENLVDQIGDHSMSRTPLVTQPSGSSVTTYQRGTTIDAMLQENTHVSNLPSYMLNHPNTEISGSSLQAHSSAQLLLYLGVPASTMPALVNNPHYFLLGFGMGAAGGALLSTISTAQLNRIEAIWSWLERSAAMNPVAKGLIGSLHVGGITANTIGTSMTTNNNEFSIFQGVVAGSIVGYEAISAAMGLIHDNTHPLPHTLDPATNTPIAVSGNLTPVPSTIPVIPGRVGVPSNLSNLPSAPKPPSSPLNLG